VDSVRDRYFDEQAFRELLAENFTYKIITPTMGSPVFNTDEWINVFSQALLAFQELEPSTSILVAEGDVVGVFGTAKGILFDGRQYSHYVTHKATVDKKTGKITSWEEHVDSVYSACTFENPLVTPYIDCDSIITLGF
jgi:ketosteroid isomerase-like protein